MPETSKSLWQSRLLHVYGDMKGQRAVDLADLHKSLGIDLAGDSAVEIVIALETYYFLASNLIAYSSFEKDPTDFLEGLRSFPSKRFRSLLK